MYSSPYLKPVCCSMSSSNCCFWTCIQISQEAGQVVWYSHLLKNIPQFVVVHMVKGFGIVNKTKVDVFLEFYCFFVDPAMLTIWSLVPLPFLNPAWTYGSIWFMYCWSLAWRILSSTLLACEMSAISWYFEHSLALPFFGIGMKTDLFQSCDHCWIFQFCRSMVLFKLIFVFDVRYGSKFIPLHMNICFSTVCFRLNCLCIFVEN